VVTSYSITRRPFFLLGHAAAQHLEALEWLAKCSMATTTTTMLQVASLVRKRLEEESDVDRTGQYMRSGGCMNDYALLLSDGNTSRQRGKFLRKAQDGEFNKEAHRRTAPHARETQIIKIDNIAKKQQDTLASHASHRRDLHLAAHHPPSAVVELNYFLEQNSPASFVAFWARTPFCLPRLVACNGAS
jgi:hypothetical protein